ncbi:hypothetical protein F4778DRAFT_768632 [Xylariomycetidae sp. FL2044]|nr:hypothetical protein F4778DRAFT_768632 [Xylariomycetidae sp. FL2044]
MFQAGATLTTETYVDQFGRPTKTETKQMLRYPKKTTLADIQGVATATLDYYLVDSLVTLYDKDGRPTATQTTSVAETPSTMTFYDEHGVATKTETILLPMSLTTYTVTVTPTSTPPSPKAKAKAAVKIDAISDARYFLGLMLPTLVAIIISIPIRVLDQTAKLYHPFHALTAHRGASAADSLALPTTGLGGFAAGFTVLTKHHVVLPLTGLLVLLSAVLTPLTSEVLRVVVLEDGTECVSAAGEGNSNGTSSSTGHGCVMSLGVFPTTARAALGVLAAMALACGVAAVALWRWRTGLYAEPWSLAAMAPLASNPEMGALLRRLGRRRGRPGVVGHAAARRALRGGSFVLDFWKDNGMTRYGVLIHNEEDEGHHNNHNPHQQEAAAAAPLKKGVKFERSGARRIKNHLPAGTAMPFFALTWTGRVLFLLLLSGVVISVLTYDIIAKGTEYERGLTGNAVGVRFVFTAVGVLVTLLWGSFFYAVSFMSPYRTLYSDRPYKGEGINLVPPTNAFAGLRFAVSPLSRDAYLGVVSAVGILAEVLPLLLGNVPCNGVGNSLAEAVCTWMSVALLCVMMFVVAGSFFVNWPPMLIDPSTVAGSMYYASLYRGQGVVLGIPRVTDYVISSL